MDREGKFFNGPGYGAGRIEKKTIKKKHTGWAVAVGRKHAEKIGVPISSKFFETRHQDPIMLMSRPLCPRPSTPPKGGDIVCCQYDAQGNLIPILRASHGKGDRPKEAPDSRVKSEGACNKRQDIPQFRSTSERLPFDDHTCPLHRSASERVAFNDRKWLDQRSTSERVVYEEDL